MKNFPPQPARKGFSLGQLVQNAAFSPLHVTRRADLFPNPFFRPAAKKELACKKPKTSTIYNLCHLRFCFTACGSRGLSTCTLRVIILSQRDPHNSPSPDCQISGDQQVPKLWVGRNQTSPFIPWSLGKGFLTWDVPYTPRSFTFCT